MPRGPTRGIEPRTPTAGCCRGGPPSGGKRTAPMPGHATPRAAGASYGRAGSPEKAATTAARRKAKEALETLIIFLLACGAATSSTLIFLSGRRLLRRHLVGDLGLWRVGLVGHVLALCLCCTQGMSESTGVGGMGKAGTGGQMPAHRERHWRSRCNRQNQLVGVGRRRPTRLFRYRRVGCRRR